MMLPGVCQEDITEASTLLARARRRIICKAAPAMSRRSFVEQALSIPRLLARRNETMLEVGGSVGLSSGPAVRSPAGGRAVCGRAVYGDWINLGRALSGGLRD